MGIRFHCHQCEHRLNVKAFLAGKRGTCPKCGKKFRIPTSDQPFSIELADEPPASIDDLAADVLADTSPAEDAGDAGASPVEASISPSTTDAVAATPVASKPAAATEDRSAELVGGGDEVWYVRPPSGGQYGPADGVLMQQWIDENRIVPESLVWRDGWPQWRVAEEVFSSAFEAPANGVAQSTSTKAASTKAAPTKSSPTKAAPSIDLDLESHLPDIVGEKPQPAKASVVAVSEDPDAVADPIVDEMVAPIPVKPVDKDQLSPRGSAGMDLTQRMERRRKKRKMMIALLAAVSIVLVGVILVILLTGDNDV